jgi:hypothetical protein
MNQFYLHCPQEDGGDIDIELREEEKGTDKQT